MRKRARRIAMGRMRAGIDIRPMKAGRGIPATFAAEGSAGTVVGIGVGVIVRGVDGGGGVGEIDVEIVVDSVAVVYRVGMLVVETVLVMYQGVFVSSSAVWMITSGVYTDTLVTVAVGPPVLSDEVRVERPRLESEVEPGLMLELVVVDLVVFATRSVVRLKELELN